MKLRTDVTVTLGREVSYFDWLKMDMEDGGLRIRAKSPLFAPYMKRLARGIDWPGFGKPHPWSASDGKLYAPPYPSPFRYEMGVASAEMTAWFQESSPNLLWLFHKDLGGEEGMDLTIKQNIDLTNFRDYFDSCADAIREIYIKYLRKASAEATFSEIWGEKGEKS